MLSTAWHPLLGRSAPHPGRVSRPASPGRPPQPGSVPFSALFLKPVPVPHSPPLTVCWRLKAECLPLEEGECQPVSVASMAYNLTHTFRDPGDYCFSIRAENVISKSHQYHRVQVWPSSK